MITRWLKKRARKIRRANMLEDLKGYGYRVTDSNGTEINGQSRPFRGYFVYRPDGSLVNIQGGYGKFQEAYDNVMRDIRKQQEATQ